MSIRFEDQGISSQTHFKSMSLTDRSLILSSSATAFSPRDELILKKRLGLRRRAMPTDSDAGTSFPTVTKLLQNYDEYKVFRKHLLRRKPELQLKMDG
jgi:hypothetical protein